MYNSETIHGNTFYWMTPEQLSNRSVNNRVQKIRETHKEYFVGFICKNEHEYPNSHLLFKKDGIYYIGPTYNNFVVRGYNFNRKVDTLSLANYYLNECNISFKNGNLKLNEFELDKKIDIRYKPSLICEHGIVQKTQNTIDKLFQRPTACECICSGKIKFYYDEKLIQKTPLGDVIKMHDFIYDSPRKKSEIPDELYCDSRVYGISIDSIKIAQKSKNGIKDLSFILYIDGIFYNYSLASLKRSNGLEHINENIKILWDSLDKIYYYLPLKSPNIMNGNLVYFSVEGELNGDNTVIKVKCKDGHITKHTINLLTRNIANNCTHYDCRYQNLKNKFKLGEDEFHMRMFTTQDYIGFYDTYVNSNTPCDMLCLKHNIKFKGYLSNLGRIGTKKIDSCPECKLESSNEAKIIQAEIDPLITWTQAEKYFTQDLGMLRYDRYSEELNILFEYDGQQHFDKNNRWYSKKLVENDAIKTKYAIDKGFNFIRIRYDEDHLAAFKSFLNYIKENPENQIVLIHGKLDIL